MFADNLLNYFYEGLLSACQLSSSELLQLLQLVLKVCCLNLQADNKPSQRTILTSCQQRTNLTG